MEKLIGLGKYLFAIPFAVFGIIHFMSANDLAGMAPGGAPMVYLAGLCLIAASISIVIGKYDKLASLLLGTLLILFIIPHAQMMSEDPMQLPNILKNISLAGGAFMYASIAKDSTYIK
jgi:uncharacterized membrane protein